MPSAILIGPPGAGKSSVARALSKITKYSVIDTDIEIEKKVGKSISDIFLDDGEPFFRQVELEVLLSCLQESDAILALGGGSVLSDKAQLALKNSKAPIIFLDVSISNAAPRVGFNKDRPLLTLNPRQQWLTLMQVRRPIYESLATIKVNTDNRKPAEVAEEIHKQLVVSP
ncbi:MAG: shikimate kinase [Actinobacteria bacterium]|nr:shikimate kinase [Actinomycetota bacterium]